MQKLMVYGVLFSLLLLVLAGWFLHQGQRAQQTSGLPSGEVVYSDMVYSDMGTWQRVDQPLLSRQHGLVGKPDYVLTVTERRRHQTIPVEVKSGKRPHTPHSGHILQLGVYCLLVEEHYGHRPSHGLLHYADATLHIPFTRALEHEVLAAAKAIRHAQDASNVRRSHDAVGRCLACGYRAACGKAALE